MTTTLAPATAAVLAAMPDGFPAPFKVRTPESRPRNQYDKVREYEWVWVLGDVPAGHRSDDDRNNAVRFTIEHNAHRKVYRAEAKVVTVSYGGQMMGEAFSFRADGLPDEATVRAPAPAPRYSRKQLDAYAAGVLADLNPLTFGMGSKVAELFAQIIAEQAAAPQAATA